MLKLDYEPHPRQVLMHKSTARQILYGGAAGGGKSHSMRWDAYAACLENPGLDAYLFRRTRVELENTHIKRLVVELPQEVGRYNGSKNRFEFVNGSYLNMCYSEHERDIENYNSVEFHWLGMDEAGHFTPYQISYARSRMRLGSFKPRQIGLFPRCILSANPGGVSHHFLKQTFIDDRLPEVEFFDTEMRDPTNPDDKGWTSIFIPAKIVDNPSLEAGYAAAFGGLPEYKQRMLREGDWDVVVGAYFDCWSDRNILRPFKLPSHLTRFRSCDWGHSTPFSIGWWVVMDGETPPEDPLPVGSIVRYREWYGSYGRENSISKSMNLGLKMDGADVARRIKEMDGDEEFVYSVAGPDMWRADAGPSQAEKMETHGIIWRKADNQRILGWQEMYERIKGEDYPMLYTFSTCVDFIRTVPNLQHEEPPRDIEDIRKIGEDHVGDECRYACMSRPMVRTKKQKDYDPYAVPTFNDLIRWRDERSVKRVRI